MSEATDKPLRATLAKFSALLAAGLGWAALIGWWLGIGYLSSLGADWIPMAPSTALLLVLFGAAVFVSAGQPLSGRAQWIAAFMVGGGTLIAALLLVLSLNGVTADAEHLGFPIEGFSNGAPLGHMSPLTAFCFLLAGVSLLVACSKRAALVLAGFACACLLIFASTVFLLAYVFGTPVLSGGRFIPPALTTSFAFEFLGIGLWLMVGSRAWAVEDLIDAESPRSARFLLLIYALLAAALVAAGYSYFRYNEKEARTQAEQQLSAIAESKVGELLAYRMERIADGEIFHRNPAFAALVRRRLERPGDREAQADLRIWLQKIVANSHYDLAMLIDANGVARLSLPEAPQPDLPGLAAPAALSPIIAKHAAAVLRSDEVEFQDFYRDEADRQIYLATLVPIFDAADSKRPLATLVFRINPNSYLYPVFTTWSVVNRSGETLLLRRDGDEALVLNELKFDKGTALALRIPLGRTEVPAVRAVLGQEGIIEGPDYRGVPALACARRVGNTDWVLLARMNLAEALEPAQANLWLVAGFIGALLLGGGAAGRVAWRQQRRSFFAQRARAMEADAAAEALRLEAAERKKALEALDAASRDLERSNAELEQFAYAASHDLQEPLRMVVGFVQLLERRLNDKLEPDTREFMNFAVDGALRMQKLIQDILAYSRVSSKGAPWEAVDTAESVKEATRMLAVQIAETGARIECGALPVVRADRTQMIQLFENLIGNGIKFCKERTPHIRIEAERAGAGWRFSVADNGIGVAPEYRERVFGVFQRLHTRREYPGTGIGLAICKRIVQRRGGEIGIEAAAQGGTVFWFILPEEYDA